MLLLNKHFARSLRVTRSREHLKLCAYLFSSYEYLVNLSIPVVLLRAYTLSKCIKMSPQGPPIMILIIITIITIIIIIIIIIIVIIIIIIIIIITIVVVTKIQLYPLSTKITRIGKKVVSQN